MEYDTRHGGPHDRGSADAYYGRPAEPHEYEGPTGYGPRILLTDPAAIAAYMHGYNTTDDRKDWG